MWRAVMLGMVLAVSAGVPVIAQVQCAGRDVCRGCGCAGGPGYRGPDGRCVSFGNLQKICGVHPDKIGEQSQTCLFENAPGTGENRACAWDDRRILPPKAHSLATP